MKRYQKGEIFAVAFAVIFGVQAILAGVAIVGSMLVVEHNRAEIVSEQQKDCCNK